MRRPNLTVVGQECFDRLPINGQAVDFIFVTRNRVGSVRGRFDHFARVLQRPD